MPRRKKVEAKTQIAQEQKAQPNPANIKPVQTAKAKPTEKKHSIKETKELIAFLGSFIYAWRLAFADGKFHWTESRFFWDSLRLSIPAFIGIGNVANELRDLDQEEVKELAAYIIKELKLAGPDVQKTASELIEDAFSIWDTIKKRIS